MDGRRSTLLAIAAVVLAALLVHAPAARFEFVLDDHPLIERNAFLRGEWSVVRAFGHHFFHGASGGAGYYRPMVVASFALNGRLAGWGPAGFHAVNVLLHAANSALVVLLARRLGARVAVAALAAALFAVHPATSWPVASIAARVDLLAATFLLSGWLAAAAPAWSGLAFLGALLCKESAVAFLAPLVMTRRLRPAIAGATALFGYSVLRLAAGMGPSLPVDRIDPPTNPLAFLPAGERMLAALRVTGRHLSYLFVPVRFSDPRGYGPGEPPMSPADPWVVGTILALALWMAVAWRLWRRRHPAAAPLAFALAAFLPASNLIVPIASLYSINYLYLPLAGICLALAAAFGTAPAAAPIPRHPGWRVAAAAAAGALLAALGAAAAVTARPWRDDTALMRDWIDRFPRHAAGHAGLGAILAEQGRPAEAIPVLRQALALDGRNAAAHYNLGLALARAARDRASLHEALRHTEIAIAGSYELVPAHVNAAKLLLDLDRFREAEAASRRALRLAPGYPPARYNLGSALFRQNRYLEAASEFADLGRDLPGDVSVRAHLLTALLMAGTLEEARHEAFRARSAFPDSGRIDVILARIEARAGRRGEALRYLRTAVAKEPGVRALIDREDDFKDLRGTAAYRDMVAAPGAGGS